MIQDCRKCGEPVMSDVARCPKCGAEMAGHGAPLAATNLGSASDVAVERSLLILGLLGLLQIVRIFASRDVHGWVQVARGFLGLLGAVFLFTYQTKDFSRLSASAKLGLRAALGLAVLLFLAVWLS